ncbi:hypothetical protein QCA50_011660 [Cerrena zonata]|uniref:F-box domain-containing protein n=1 Tax=Cerrena zonata TaxID=2478898 RepID=A0AAW0FYU3_9APHY
MIIMFHYRLPCEHCNLSETDHQVQQMFGNDNHRYLQAIIELRRRSNSLIHINRLPLELLVEIFTFCQIGEWNIAAKRDDEQYCNRIAMPLRWIFLTGTCYHWRQVAFQTPKLWTQIDLDYPEFARYLSLPLAKGSPLCLVMTQGRWGPDQVLLLNDMSSDLNINCVQSINWSLPFGSLGSDVTIPSSITSALTSIRIKRHHSPTTLPDPFNTAEFPRIENLELINCITNLPSQLLSPTLKHLTLQADYIQRIDPITFTQCLSNMPHLESLEVRGVSFRNGDTPPSLPLEKLILSNLRHLVIRPPHPFTITAMKAQGAIYQDYFTFLERLEVPLATHIQLMALHGTSARNVVTIFLTFRPFTFRTLALCSVANRLVVGLWKDTMKPGSIDTKTPNPPYGIWLPNNLQTQHILWKQFPHTLSESLQPLETLYLADLDFHQDDIRMEWKQLFRACRRLKDLGLKGNIAHKVIPLLWDATEFVPELETIYFTDVTWRSLSDGYDGHLDNFSLHLAIAIENRKKAGCPIRKMVIERCVNISELDIDDIQHNGVTIEWDGDGHVVGEEEDEYDDDDDDEEEEGEGSENSHSTDSEETSSEDDEED